MRVWQVTALALAVTAFIPLFGPFLVPVPPLPCVATPERLADDDSLFLPIGRLQVHAKVVGAGGEGIVLLHGFADSTYSWREVAPALASRGTVVAFDRPAFGLTSRPLWPFLRGGNPYTPEAQADLTVAVMDALGIQRAVLVGHSAGGAVAALAALRHPERVRALVLEAPAVNANPIPSWLRWMLRTPQARYLGPLAARVLPVCTPKLVRLAWANPGVAGLSEVVGYGRAFCLCHWDRALWEQIAAGSPPNIIDRLDALPMPILLITGDSDRVVPTAETVELARTLPNAELVVVPGCAHLVHDECSEAFVRAVERFLDGLAAAP